MVTKDNMKKPSLSAIARLAFPAGIVPKLLMIVAMVALLPLNLKAQSTYGAIVGTATDTTGAVVPDATVTVTNLGTGQAVKVQTDAGGKYSVQDLPPAEYKVTVEKASFKRVVHDDVPVQVGATSRVDLSLAVGDVNQTVEVTSQAAQLQTDSSSLSQQVEGDIVQQMPLNGRNVMNLVELAPGVIPTGSASGGTGLDQAAGRTAGGIGWNNYEIGGGIQGWSANYIDGIPNQLLGDNVIALVPTQDAVQEFSVVSSNATADYGRFAGGVINMSTKSGANKFHGSAYEYLRNRDFNANTWFNNHTGLPRGQWNQDQYGASLSGPIKKDKAFFLFTWENFKALTSTANAFVVPSQNMQNGILNHAFVDPLKNCNISTTVNPGFWTITNLYGPGLNGGTCGDPVNRVLKEMWPLPNPAGQNGGAGYNWLLNSSLGNSQTQYNGRVDYALSQKQRLFARYTYWTLGDKNNSIFGNQGSPAFGSTSATTWPTATNATSMVTHQGTLADTYALNSTTVIDVRAGVTRQLFNSAPFSTSVSQAQFDQYATNKYYTALGPQEAAHTLPEVTVSGADGLYAFGSVSNFNYDRYNTYSIGGSVSKILGAHTLKAGFEARLMDNSGTPFAGGASGYYTYSTQFSNDPINNIAGDEFASFLMGYPSGGKAAYFQTFQYTAGYSYYQGYYLMDNWQATNKLTLNLGLRYELPGAPAERNNKLSVLLPNAVDPYTGITGTEALVNSSLYGPRTAVVESHNLFAPRIGVAYRVTSTTVFRGGYGLSYIPNDLSGPNGFGTLPFLSPFNATLTSTPQPANATPLSQTVITQTGTVAPILGSAPFSNGLLQPSPKPQPNFMTSYGSTTKYLGQSIVAPVPYQPYPYVQQWNADLSHQFKGDFLVEVSYSGLKGTNLPQIGNPPQTYFGLDELNPKYYSLGYTLLSSAIGSTAATAAGYGTCPNAPGLTTITVAQCLRPNPYYSDMQDAAHWAGIQNYRSLQVTTQKRFGSNGVFNANYSWSKNQANTDSANQQLENTAAARTGHGIAGLQDYYNTAADYSLITYDVTNRLILNYVLNLPFGKGQRYANNLGNVGTAFASGWSINGITTFQSGFPIFIQSSSPNFLTNNLGAGQLRPNAVAGCTKKIDAGSQTKVLAGAWFNTSCFAKATSGSDPTGNLTFGNEPRVDPDIRADGIKNFDFSFQKSTPIFESSNFVFRAEFFNIMNRVQYNPPVNTFGSANFGAILTQRNNPRQIQLSARVNF